ncbi:G-D-S-L family lipolytic protein [Lacinutrix sp. WUR7]|uniref:G-D-S-L family lipolytic protein n=1 Tax=Lacinutrix sp. WUR7 TaxID=2653681 RepID=UPI00193D6F60|nr:G-D-S-L family lipolytic protein [Lacinutrix sp. WUR7]QRM88524.1 G-D-S-L family lipolytic protein [Lacinutrix sp. WUR7]
MKNIKYALLAAVLVGFTACKSEDDFIDSPEPEVTLPALTAGSADFSNYVAIGASFTAGYTDSGLFIAGQEDSFPNTLAKQFANAGGGVFTQPLMNDNYGGLIAGGSPIISPLTGERLFAERLVFGGAGPVPLQSVNPAAMSTTDFVLNNPTGPFNNLGVPGAKSYHLLAPGFGSLANFPAAANPYAIRLTGLTPNASILDLAVDQAPTFFTLSEIGGNDVLGYAVSGGDGSDLITPLPTFDAALNGIIARLTSNGTNNVKGVVGNVPNITSLSHFTTVPYNPIPLNTANAALLNGAYAQYNGGLQVALANNLITADEAAARTIMFEVSTTNTMVLIDENLTDLSGLGLPSYRPSTSTDLFVLPLSTLIPDGYGTQIPLADKWVLTPEEQAEIATATMNYNTSIKAATDANPNLALVDLNDILDQATTTGIIFDEYDLNTELVFGGLVSLDGVHLTSRGYALMANAFLDAIDTNFGSNFRASGNVAKATDYGVNHSPLLP